MKPVRRPKRCLAQQASLHFRGSYRLRYYALIKSAREESEHWHSNQPAVDHPKRLWSAHNSLKCVMKPEPGGVTILAESANLPWR